MIDKTRNEALAIERAGITAGEFIQELISQGAGSNLAEWDRDTYFAFIEVVVTSFVETMQELKSVPESA